MAMKPDFEFADAGIIKTWASSMLWLAAQRDEVTDLILDEIRDEILAKTCLTDFWEEEFGQKTIDHASRESSCGYQTIMAQEP